MTVYAIVGGGGKVALRFTRLATAASHRVINLVRNETHFQEIESAGGEPKTFDLESSSATEIASTLTEVGAEGVMFAAGAGGKGGPERTKKVDYEGALKVFEAIKIASVNRFLLISAVDCRDRSQPPPSYYDEEDLQISDRMWDALGAYMQAKTDADKYLTTKTSIPYIVLRPGQLLDTPSVQKVQLAIADREGSKGLHLSGGVTREDVGAAALALMEEKRVDKKVIDVMGGRAGKEGQEGMSVESAVRVLVEQL